jgi:hypothetical protein
MQQTFDRSYDFDSKDPNVAVMARNSDGRWSKTTLGDVRVFSGFTHFYFVDNEVEGHWEEVEEVEDEEMEEPSSVELARQSVNEMIEWIRMWSMRVPAVDDKLNEFHDQIFEHLDAVESEMTEW